jgi:hypothetical protein
MMPVFHHSINRGTREHLGGEPEGIGSGATDNKGTIINGPPALRSIILPQRNSFAKPKGSGQKAPEVWPRPLGLGGRGSEAWGWVGRRGDLVGNQIARARTN